MLESCSPCPIIPLIFSPLVLNITLETERGMERTDQRGSLQFISKLASNIYQSWYAFILFHWKG